MTVVMEALLRSRPAAEADGPLVPAAGRGAARSRRYLVETEPWRRKDALLPLVLAVLGTVGVVICYVGAADKAAFRKQIPWLVAGCGSVGVFVLGAALWLLIGLRRVRHGIHELHADAHSVFGLDDLDAPEETTAFAPTDLVTGPGMQRAHRPDCLLVRGKTVHAIPPAELDAHSRCPMCLS